MESIKLNPKLLSMTGQAGAIFGVLLPAIADTHPEITILSADMSTPAGLDKFKTTYPSRFFNIGIAEQNMVGVGAGMAHEGYQTVLVAQACFISMRCFEQIRQFSGYMRIPQIYVGLSSGFSLTYLGATHWALEDIALMKLIPNMTVVAPCDAVETVKAFQALLELASPAYLRLYGGGNLPIIFKEDYDFELGKAVKLRNGDEVQIIACGSMVHQALAAASLLETHGISAEVVDMHTIRPLDTDILRKDVKLIVTLEEHRYQGGLGESVASWINGKTYPKLQCICAENNTPKPGSLSYLYEMNGLSAEQISSIIKNEIAKQ